MSRPCRCWKAEVTINFTVAQDHNNRTITMLCNGSQIQIVPATNSSMVTPHSPDSGYYGTVQKSPQTQMKSACRPPSLPLPELPSRWINHYGLVRQRRLGRHGAMPGVEGNPTGGSRFTFNCNNGGGLEEEQIYENFQR